MRKEIYFLNKKRTRIYLNADKHPETIRFLASKPRAAKYKKYFASGFIWMLISKELDALNLSHFFIDKGTQRHLIYSIANSQLSKKKIIIEKATLLFWKIRAAIRRPFTKRFIKNIK